MTDVKRFKFYSLDLDGNGIIDVDGGLQLPVQGDYPLEVGESVRIYTRTLTYLGTDGADGAIFEDPTDKSLVYGSDTAQLNAGEPLPEIVEEPLELDGGGETPEPPEGVPVISISPPEVNQDEGDVGTTEYTFTITRSGDGLSEPSSVDVAFVAGDTNADDFGGTLPESQTVEFAAGQTTKTVTISVSGDTDFEFDETFEVSLEFATDAVIDDEASSATGTIINDDEFPVDFNPIEGTEESDFLPGTDGNDLMLGLGGTDIMLGAGGNDIMDGGEGDDIMLGGEGIDVMVGGAGDDTIFGDAGNDVLGGGEGSDVIFGGADTDILIGGNGEDVLNGGEGNDILMGGLRNDVFEFNGNFGTDIVQDFDDRDDALQFEGADEDDISVENVNGGTLLTVESEETNGRVFLAGVEVDDGFLFF